MIRDLVQRFICFNAKTIQYPIEVTFIVKVPVYK